MVQDITQETHEHIRHVRDRLDAAITDLETRFYHHDASKVLEPEATGFYEMNQISRRSDVSYGSPEYKALMASQRPAIDHHYHHNDHHPEYWLTHDAPCQTWDLSAPEDLLLNGTCVSSMTLGALIEMICDWSAASIRYKDGSFHGSFKKNCDRFGIGYQLASILLNSAVAYDLITVEQAREALREIVPTVAR